MTKLASDPGRITAVRRFSRFYTGAIGMLRERLHDSRFSLTEARVLYELANRQSPTATDVARELGLDPGYLSRILQRFVRDGLLRRDRVPHDGRQTHLMLTTAGRDALGRLEAASAAEVGALLARLPEPAQTALVAAMGQIETLLGGIDTAQRPWLLRGPRPGDIGWVVARHADLYAREYAFDAQFEALVAKVTGAFLEKNDPVCERCWMSARSSWCAATPRPQSYACCWLNRPRATRGSVGGWWLSAWISPGSRAIAASCCGPTTS
jgi:DNA-binding MarR family transcriptional regulator